MLIVLLLLAMIRGQLLARPPLFDVLLRVRRVTCTRPHTRPQVNERDDAFVAVERYSGGDGVCRIRRHGLEKILMSFPSSVGDVDVMWLSDDKFSCPVWREGECLRGAGEWEGRGRDGGG